MNKRLKTRLCEFANGVCLALAGEGMLEQLQDTWFDFYDGEKDNKCTFDIHVMREEGKWSAYAYPTVDKGDGSHCTDTSEGHKLKLSCFELLDEMLEEQ